MENAVIYVDPSIIISAAVDFNEQGEKSRSLLFNYPSFASSILAFSDALTTITRISGKQQAIWMCERFAKLPNLSIVQSSIMLTRQAIENYKNQPLTPRQAIHLAYAQVNGITQIASLDVVFDKVKGIKRVKL